MATNLTFTQDGSKYVCTITPTAPCVIQIQRGTDGRREPFTVYAYLDDMNPVGIYTTDDYGDIIFELDVPEGVTVKLVSWRPVIAAKMV